MCRRPMSRRRFVLARALVAAKRSREEAIALAKQARKTYRDARDAKRETLLEVERWLAEHER
jgi:hypothetical protein